LHEGVCDNPYHRRETFYLKIKLPNGMLEGALKCRVIGIVGCSQDERLLQFAKQAVQSQQRQQYKTINRKLESGGRLSFQRFQQPRTILIAWPVGGTV
jgi:hypothetical protein